MYRVTKRPDSSVWQIEVRLKGCKPIRRSSGTSEKSKAEELARSVEADLWDQVKLGGRPKFIWEDAVIQWRIQAENTPSLYDDLIKLKILRPYFDGVALKKMDTAFIDSALKSLAKSRNLKPATVNRYMNLIRAILNQCEKSWGMIDKAPFLKHWKTQPRAVRWIPPHEAEQLINACLDIHKAPVRLAFSCGLRKSNIYGLEWQQVDFNRSCAWVEANEAKGKKAIPIPLNSDAIEIIKGQIGKHPIKVFPINPMINRTWKAVCEKAMITNFRFHDIRHTWASWHVMAGTSLNELMELGGWSKIDMVLVYAHLSAEHLKASAERVSTFVTRSKSIHKGENVQYIDFKSEFGRHEWTRTIDPHHVKAKLA